MNTTNFDLIDWECIDSDTKYLTHNIHRYSGKFIPQIAKNAIELITKPGDLVLDVYCGSGTTLLECLLSGRRSIGIDLNPVAKLITDVKIKYIDKEKLKEWREHFIISILSLTNNQHDLLYSELQITSSESESLKNKVNDEWFSKWFQALPLELLGKIQILIDRIEDIDLKNIATLVMSDILRKNSNAHSSYPNVMFDKKKRELGSPINSYIKRLNEVCDAVIELSECNISPDMTPCTILGSNTDLKLDSESIDAIVTHPPYIGSVPYAEYGILSLKWLGYDPKKLDSELTGGQRQRKVVVDRFQSDYHQMFSESYRVLKEKGYMFIMVGNPTVKGELIDLSKMSDEAAISNGFKKIREIKRNGVNRRANKMGKESMIFYQK